MNVTITSIENAGPGNRARRLVLDEGTQIRLTAASVVKDLSLESGQIHEPESLASELDEAEVRLAKERALRILGYRERSAAEVDQRLLDDGYPPEVARDTVARFSELGLIDDSRFAAVYSRSRLAAGFGTRRIASELKQRGVAPEIAVSALREAMDGYDEVERAIGALRGRVPRDRRERERLLRHLVSKGFDLSTALAALDSAAGPDAQTPSAP